MAPLRRLAWRGWYRLRWWLVDRRALATVRIRHVAGLDLIVLPGVLDPALFFSSEVLAAAIRRLARPGMRVLDLGAGCGIGALTASEAGAATVVAGDVDPIAIRCCQVNVALHGLSGSVDCRLGDLFEVAGREQFDLVAFNPPYLAGRVPAALGRALKAPADLAGRFAAGLADRLAPGGSAVIVLSTNGNPDAYLGPLRGAGFVAEALMSRDRGSEDLTAWVLTRWPFPRSGHRSAP